MGYETTTEHAHRATVSLRTLPERDQRGLCDACNEGAIPPTKLDQLGLIEKTMRVVGNTCGIFSVADPSAEGNPQDHSPLAGLGRCQAPRGAFSDLLSNLLGIKKRSR